MTAIAVQVAPSQTPAQAGAWRVVDARPLGCLSMSEAIRRTLASEYYHGAKSKNAAWQWCYRLARESRDRDPSPVMYGGALWIPAALHPAFSEPAGPTHAAETIKFLSADRRARLAAKTRALHDFTLFWRGGEGRGLGRVEALKRFAATHGTTYRYHDGRRERTLKLSVRSLERWGKLRDDGGLDALATDGRGRYEREQPDGAATAFYWSVRNDPKKRTIAQCWRLTADEAQSRRWPWFKSAASCSAWDRRARNERALTLNRDGDRAFTARAEPYLEADPESFAPGECWESDHSTINVWLRHNGAVMRPVLTAWLDWRSRAIVGWSVVVAGNSDSILIAFRDGAKRYGLPTFAVMDNGKDFSAQIWTGGRPKRRNGRAPDDFIQRTEGTFAMLAVTPRWVLPYSPNSKARIERFFRTFDEQFAREFPSYCAGKPENRPADHCDLVEQAIPLDEFVPRLAQWIDVYNNTPHSGEGMAGRTPLQVLALAERKRVLTDEQALFLLAAWPKPVKLGRNGVAIPHAGEPVRYGAFAPELNALPIGTLVRVTYDPADLSAVNVWAMDGHLICRAEENHRFNRRFSGEEHRAALRERNRARRVLREARRTGVTALADPVVASIAAQAADSSRRRLPDPTPPGGGPLLVPLQTPIQPPSNDVRRLRKVVGGPDVMLDLSERLAAFAERTARERLQRRGGGGQADLLRRWAESAVGGG